MSICSSQRRTSHFLIFGWLLLMLYVYIFISVVREKPQDVITEEYNNAHEARFERAITDYGSIEKQSNAIKQLFNADQPISILSVAEREKVRRKIENGIQELYYFISAQLKHLENFTKNGEKPDVEAVLAKLSTQFHSVKVDQQRQADLDRTSLWSEIRLNDLSKLLQKRLKALQNPSNCAKARRLQCDLNKACGFGCQLHHVTYCFIVAYATERTLILTGDGKKWDYAPDGWMAAFLPVSDTCSDQISEYVKPWVSLEQSKNHLVISMPVVDGLSNPPPFMPLAFPKDLAADLIYLHGNPPVWFIGHFVDYLMRSSPQLDEFLTDAERNVNFDNGPIVGIQVRRTDKIGTEAAYHSVDEYMVWVDQWFALQSLKLGKQLPKRVLVATDDPVVIEEIKGKYKNYEIISDTKIASSAKDDKDRYTKGSLFGVITDIRLLSKCDYLVCTFSSQVCRLAYELMQVDRGDAAANFHSLDDIYYFGGQQPHEQEAILPHSPTNKDEIELRVGDVIGVAGNHWNGFSKGHNRRTNQTGLYPSYKVKEKWIVEEFSTYPNIKV